MVPFLFGWRNLRAEQNEVKVNLLLGIVINSVKCLFNLEIIINSA